MCLSRAHGCPSAGHGRCFSTGGQDVASESVRKRRVRVACVVLTQFTVSGKRAVFWPVATV